MSIDRFFTTQFTTTRMSWSDESSAEVAGASFMGHIQQSRAEFAEYINEKWGYTFSVWCPVDTDVDEGDTITVASGSYAGSYTVKNVQVHAIGNNSHLELIAIKVIT